MGQYAGQIFLGSNHYTVEIVMDCTCQAYITLAHHIGHKLLHHFRYLGHKYHHWLGHDATDS